VIIRRFDLALNAIAKVNGHQAAGSGKTPGPAQVAFVAGEKANF